MHEPTVNMTSAEEVAMIFDKDDEDDGPSTSKRARLSSSDEASSSSYDDDMDYEFFQRRACDRSIGHRKQIQDDSSDSDSSSRVQPKVFPNVDAYLASIPEFDVTEHLRIPSYMESLGDYAKQIQTELPRSDNYSDERMEVVRKNFILSQLEFLVREHVRRTARETPKENLRISLPRAMAQGDRNKKN